MSVRSAVSGVVLASLGAAAVVALAAALSPEVRRRALQLSGRAPSIEPEEPTHIVLPDRAVASWSGLGAAIDEGRRVVSGDVALAGA
jgi:hypothetical protein